LGAAKRTLDGEDRSEMIAEEGKAGRKIGERWSAILAPSPAASNTLRRASSSCWRSIAPAAPASRRLARLTMDTTMSRSRNSSAAGLGDAFGSTCRCALKNNSGCKPGNCMPPGAMARRRFENGFSTRLLASFDPKSEPE
jgi:hypothetical protein